MKDSGIQISDFSFRASVILLPKWKPLLHRIPVGGYGSRKKIPWKQSECKLILLGLRIAKKLESEHKYKQSHTKPQRHWRIPMEGDVDFNLRKIYNLSEKQCYKLKMLFFPLEMKNLPLLHCKFIISAIELIKSEENVSVLLCVSTAMFTSLSNPVIHKTMHCASSKHWYNHKRLCI